MMWEMPRHVVTGEVNVLGLGHYVPDHSIRTFACEGHFFLLLYFGCIVLTVKAIDLF